MAGMWGPDRVRAATPARPGGQQGPKANTEGFGGKSRDAHSCPQLLVADQNASKRFWLRQPGGAGSDIPMLPSSLSMPLGPPGENPKKELNEIESQVNDVCI